MNRRDVLKSCVVAASVTGCSTPAASDSRSDDAGSWTKFRYDQRNTGHNPHADGPSQEPQLEWFYETGDDVWGSPVVADGTVYVGSYDHHLYAISTETGEKIWGFRADDRIDGTPAVVDDTVYFGSFDRSVYALDARTGEKRWEQPTDGLVRSSPTVVDGTLFIGTHCYYAECNTYSQGSLSTVGYVYALDTKTGKMIWRYETDDEILSSAAATSGTIYIGTSDGKIYAIDQLTGELNWDFQTGGSIYGTPAVAGSTVYITSNNGRAYALDSNTGERVWTFLTNAKILTSSPAVHDGVVYVGGGGLSNDNIDGINSRIYAISTDRGDEIWSRDVPGEVIGSSPAIADDTIYLSSNNFTDASSADPGIFSYTDSGTEHWRYTVGNSEYFADGAGFGSSPAIIDNTLYIGSADGRIYSFT